MRGAVFQFRQALKGCPFHPSGGANGLTGKSEPNVTILDGMTAKPVSCASEGATDVSTHADDLTDSYPWTTSRAP